MPADSMLVVTVVTVGFVLFMAVLALTAWYDRQGRGPSPK